MTRPSPLPRHLLAAILTVALACNAGAQEQAPVPDGKAITVLTDSLAAQLTRYYVDRNAALRMSAVIKKNRSEGRYKDIRDAHVLAGRLTSDLLAVHRDEHLHVDYNPALAYELSGNIEDVPGMVAEKLQRDRARNFGFRKVEILGGNVGYLELSGFSRLNQFSRATADAALHLLGNASALIIDLRYGSGGSPEMMTYILGHFYSTRVHVGDIYIRSENSTLSYHTTPDSSFSSLHTMPLYILTSYKTFSAAEGFANTLKRTGRATIVGERTRGGAHTVTYRPLSSGFVCDIPFGQARDPVTGKNWEGRGIEPDVPVSERLALETAYDRIFAGTLSAAKDSAEKKRLRLQRDLTLSKNNPVSLDSIQLRKLTGVYGPCSISYQDGFIYFQKTGMAKYPLLPLSATALCTKGCDDFIVELYRDASGSVNRIATIYVDGRVEYADRNP